MIKYRIVEKEFGDGRIKFFPEAYSETYKKISKVETDGWISVADVELRVTDEGYETLEEAKLKIDEHKNIKLIYIIIIYLC